MERDEKEDNLKSRGQEKNVHIQSLISTINTCGVTFRIWEEQSDGSNGKTTMKWTSLMGSEKKNLLYKLPGKLKNATNGIHSDTAATVINVWEDFGVIYKCAISSMKPIYVSDYTAKMKEWINLFLSLSRKRKGYGKANVTAYMHAATYHVQNVLETYGNLKQFSGQAVEENNDVARNVVRRKCNNWDTAADILRTEHRQSMLQHRERAKRQYIKKTHPYWEVTKRENCKKKKEEVVSNVVVQVEDDSSDQRQLATQHKQAAKKGKQSKGKSQTTKRKK